MLEDQIDKMGPRMPNITDKFIRLRYLVEFQDAKEVPAPKPTLHVKTYILITNPGSAFDTKQAVRKLKLWFSNLQDDL